MGLAKIARRTFLIGSVAIAGGVAVGYYYVKKPYPNPLENGLDEGETSFNPFIKIAADNTITIIAPRAEMGQGVHTTLAAFAAEELDVSLEQVKVEHGPAAWVYYNTAAMEEAGPFSFFDESFIANAMRSSMVPLSKLLGLQMTGGSSSARDYYDKMRQSGAAARQMLLAAAGQEMGVPVANLETHNGSVVYSETGASRTYGELAAKAAEVEAPGKVTLKDAKDWKLLGKSQARTDIPKKVTAKAVFGIDVDLPDMVYGTVKMSPRFGAKPRSHDETAALNIPGVQKIVPIQSDTAFGFGIIADNTWAAFKGAEALEVEWEEATYPKFDDGLFDKIRDEMKAGRGFSLRDDGDVDLSFADAAREDILEVEYTAPYLAHATMEPMNATAQFKDGKLEIWAPNQAPTMLQMAAAPLVGVEVEDVIINTTFLGGGFGRRAEIDFTVYAVEMAKHTGGNPIKVTWTREEDMSHDTYRPIAVAKMRALVEKGVGPKSVDVHCGSPSIVKSFLERSFPSISAAGPDRTIVEGAFDQPYKIENYRVSGTAVDFPIPVGFWRSVGNSYNGFFHESFMDEIAIASKVDPLELRLKLMADYPAAIGVLKKVAQMSNWGKSTESDVGFGIAHTLSFGAWVAQVVKIRMVGDDVRIENVWCAVEMGTVLDPGIVKAQMMSGIIFGLSSAMGQEITFEKGEVVEKNFDDYDSMRMSQCPVIEVELLETYHKMAGAGEPGTPPSIPALANAIFDATGLRLRNMPLSKSIDFA